MKIYRTDSVWLAGMKGCSYEQVVALLEGVSERTSGKTLEELDAAYDVLAAEYKDFLANEADLLAVKEFPHPTYGVLRASIDELIHHIVNHGTYHRGNISSMLRQAGHAGASSDFVFYLYELNK